MLLDPRSASDQNPVTVHNKAIKQVTSYKYFGVHSDRDFSWHTHVAAMSASIHQCLHFLCRLRLFSVCKNIILIFYRAILRYSLTGCVGNLTVQSKTQIHYLIRTAGKIMGHIPFNLQELFDRANNILTDSFHVLCVLLNSGRRCRVPLCEYNRYKHSFVPLSFKVINEQT